MTDLTLQGPLALQGILHLKADGGKLVVNGQQALVEHAGGQAPPVIQPPPPAAPLAPGPDVDIVSSLGKAIDAGGIPVVTTGMVLQAGVWPGMVLPSSANAGPTAVTAGGIPINVVGDRAVIFPSGASATFTNSGQ